MLHLQQGNPLMRNIHIIREFKEKLENIVIINAFKLWQYHKMNFFLFEWTAIVLEILFDHLLFMRNWSKVAILPYYFPWLQHLLWLNTTSYPIQWKSIREDKMGRGILCSMQRSDVSISNFVLTLAMWST